MSTGTRLDSRASSIRGTGGEGLDDSNATKEGKD